jgi:hypothetical protein
MTAAVRPWLTSRFVLVALLLVVAPGAALAHLLVNWLPARMSAQRLRAEVAQQSVVLAKACQEQASFSAATARLERALQTQEPALPVWLPQRDRDGTFDRFAEALRDDRVTLDRLTFGDPAVYAAVNRNNLLACERINIECTGAYGELATCLDRISALDLPVRVTRLAWSVSDDQLKLNLNTEVPFVPDTNLRKQLADAAHLPEEGQP